MHEIYFETGLRPSPKDSCYAFNDRGELALDSTGALPLVSDLGAAVSGGTEIQTELVQIGRSPAGPLWVWTRLGESALQTVAMRSYAQGLGPDQLSMVFRAYHIRAWLDKYRFCAQCGTALRMRQHELAQECPSCAAVFYPVISPAVIVAITRKEGSEVLLALAKKRISTWHSLIAGYVEAGESLEEAVHREVLEETGITIKNLRYHESQGWPFSQSLMAAFYAEYKSGDIVVETEELDDAGWFPVDRLPAYPPPPSVAHRLISGLVRPSPSAQSTR